MTLVACSCEITQGPLNTRNAWEIVESIQHLIVHKETIINYVNITFLAIRLGLIQWLQNYAGPGKENATCPF